MAKNKIARPCRLLATNKVQVRCTIFVKKLHRIGDSDYSSVIITLGLCPMCRQYNCAKYMLFFFAFAFSLRQRFFDGLRKAVRGGSDLVVCSLLF